MEPKLEDLRRLDVQPGDTVVLRTPDRLSVAACDRLREGMAGVLPPSVKTVVLEGGMDLSVVSATDGRRIPDLLDANTRAHERNVALSAALIALVEHFERVDGSEADKAAIKAACDVWAGNKAAAALEGSR